MVYQKIQELVRILLHVVVEFFLLLAQPGNELLGCYRADLLLLGCYTIEQVSQTGQQRFLRAFVFGLILKNLLPEWPAEVERLQD